jgi:hypothetical protein
LRGQCAAGADSAEDGRERRTAAAAMHRRR